MQGIDHLRNLWPILAAISLWILVAVLLRYAGMRRFERLLRIVAAFLARRGLFRVPIRADAQKLNLLRIALGVAFLDRTLNIAQFVYLGPDDPIGAATCALVILLAVMFTFGFLTPIASIALLFRHLSASRVVTIAQIEGRVRAAGSEFVLACDMRFAARESALFAQFEPAFGAVPGGGAAQHLTRLMGRARALEVMLSAHDYDAGLAERYGWINRALPAAELGGFVRELRVHQSGLRRLLLEHPRADHL